MERNKTMSKIRKTIVEKTILPKIKNKNNSIHIAFIYGGRSVEREVSLLSKNILLEAISDLGYKVTPVDMGADIAIHLDKIKPNLVYIGLYGTYSEDGRLQGLLDIMGLKYTHSGMLTSAIGMNKVVCNEILIPHGIKCPERIIIHKNQQLSADPMPRPYVIKPVSEGSSLGVDLVFEGDKFDMSQYKWEYGDTMIVEKYVSGIEISVAVLDGKSVGAVEPEPMQNKFHDYDTKYVPGMVKHHIPPRISEAAYQRCLDLASKIYHILKCRTLTRVDFIYSSNEGSDGEFYFLEVNTHPGMTPTSMVPDICAFAGLPFKDVVEKLIEDGLTSSL